MNIEIRSHWSSTTILWSGEAKNVRDAVEQAVRSRASLIGASLDGASLDGAILIGASLDGASLDGAILDGAILDGASLDGAILDGASLVDASLVDARLDGARLVDARLDGASLDGASLDGASLVDASLVDASLDDARLGPTRMPDRRLWTEWSEAEQSALVPPMTPERAAQLCADAEARRIARRDRYRAQHPDVPIVEQPDAKILAGIEARSLLFDMSDWHRVTDCGTAHCRAGSIVDLAGPEGYELERRLGGTAAAGRALYLASTGRVPRFYGGTEKALEDIRRCAAEDADAFQKDSPSVRKNT